MCEYPDRVPGAIDSTLHSSEPMGAGFGPFWSLMSVVSDWARLLCLILTTEAMETGYLVLNVVGVSGLVHHFEVTGD